MWCLNSFPNMLQCPVGSAHLSWYLTQPILYFYLFLLKEDLQFCIKKKEDLHIFIEKRRYTFSIEKRRSNFFIEKEKIYNFLLEKEDLHILLKKGIYTFCCWKEKFYIFYWKTRSRNTWTFPAGSNALNVGQLKQIAKVIVATKKQKNKFN